MPSNFDPENYIHQGRDNYLHPTSYFDFDKFGADYSQPIAYALMKFLVAHNEFNSDDECPTDGERARCVSAMVDARLILDENGINPYAVIDACTKIRNERTAEYMWHQENG